MSQILEKISKIGLVPVVVDKLTEEGATALGQALVRGGIPVAEVTFRTEGAEKTIAAMRANVKDLIVGAGTVLSVEQAELAIRSGAQFLVAPGLNADVVKVCQAHGVDVLPGVCTPTEIEAALNLGLTTVKFFPSSVNGGVAAMKALNGPYKSVKFIPTGGIGLNDLAEYAAYDGIAAVGGSFMLGSHVAAGEWDSVTELCKQSVRAMLGLRLGHVGINADDEGDARGTVKALSELLLLPMGKEGSSSIFVDSAVEVMKSPYLGAKGHIGFTCNNVRRTADYLSLMGVELNQDSAKRGPNGALTAVYFKEEIAGFALHIFK